MCNRVMPDTDSNPRELTCMWAQNTGGTSVHVIKIEKMIIFHIASVKPCLISTDLPEVQRSSV
eukprot:c2337_g1_i1 orf=229-417(+)